MCTTTTTTPKVFAPKSKAELQAAITACMKASDFDCSKGPHGPIGSWDVSAVTDMSEVFSKIAVPGADKFNGDISKWDVSSVTTMYRMFYTPSSFNGDISKWDVSGATNMRYMFYASSFKGDLSKWDVSKVTTMEGMFQSAKSFNGDLSKWDVSRVTNMLRMFNGAKAFSQTLCGAWQKSTANKKDIFSGSSGKFM